MVEALNNSPQDVKATAKKPAIPITKKDIPAYAMLYYVSLTLVNVINRSISMESQEIKANAAAQSPLQHILTQDLNWIQPDPNHDPATMQAYLANINAQNKRTANEQQDIQMKMASLRQTGSIMMGQASSEMANVPQAANLINGMQEVLDDVDQAWSSMSLSPQA